MRNKLTLLIITFFVLGSLNLFSIGIGLQGNINAGEFFAPGVAVSLKLESIPVYFAFNWKIEDDVKNFSLTADYWALNKEFLYIGRESLNFFFGLGGFGNITFDERDSEDFFQPSIGVRIPIGVNMYLLDNVVEPFIQIAPSFGLQFIPTIAADEIYWPLSAGVRLWL